VLASVWGCSFWWIDVALSSFSPLAVAFGRLAIGAVALLLIAGATGTRLPRGFRIWGHLVVLGLLFNSVPFVLFAYAETHVSSALAGILNSLTPIATLSISTYVFRIGPPSRRVLIGLAIGTTGVLIVAGAWNGFGHSQIVGIGACLLAVASFGVAFSYSPRFLAGRGEPVALAAGQVICGAAILLPLVLAFDRAGKAVTRDPVLALIALGVLGTGVAYVLNFDVARHASPTVASSVTYLIPVFAVAAGAAFLGEAISWHDPVGAIVILLGAAVSQGFHPGCSRRKARKVSDST
jgi:drug/metabolite transporter (DMT)-like permease